MDISNIGDVANRKRMNTDADKLREKVSRETAKIIKLKVAQDTAYWDLKEKLQQSESNHERLQQNMVEVQMQYEAISGQYQEELRLRPDTLNKLSATRGICDVLEEYGERLGRSVASCRADQRALGDAYGACGERVRGLVAAAAAARTSAVEQQEATRAAAARHEADLRRLEQKTEQLGATRATIEALTEQRQELVERLERATTELRRREDATVALQADVTRLVREYDAQNDDLRKRVAARESEIQELVARCEHMSAEQSASEQRAALLQQQLDAALRRVERLNADQAEAITTIEQLKLEVASLSADKVEMEKMISENTQQTITIEAEIVRLKDQLSNLRTEKMGVDEQLREALQECGRAAEQVEDMERLIAALEKDKTEAQTALATQRAADMRRVDELNTVMTEKERDLDAKTHTITRLMTDLKTEAEARARSDAALATARKQHDAENEASATVRADLTATVARLETTIRAKDDELAKQMSVILEIRDEKGRLQERINAMQGTIDNIQKELKGPVMPPPTPGERECDATPRRADNDLLYNFLSDGSEDGNAFNALEVKQRIQALARGDLSLRSQRPISLSQVKKDLKMKNRTFFKNKRLERK